MRQAGGTRHRAPRTAAQWRTLIERFEGSGQTPGQVLRGERIGAEYVRPVAAQAVRDAGDGRRRTPRGVVRGADPPGADADGSHVVGDRRVGGRALTRRGYGAAAAPGGAMLSGLSAGRIWLCTRPTGMRCSFDGLSARVRRYLGEDPTSGQWFVFINRRRRRLVNANSCAENGSIAKVPWTMVASPVICFLKSTGSTQSHT